MHDATTECPQQVYHAMECAWSQVLLLVAKQSCLPVLTFIHSRVVIMHLHHYKVLLSNSTHWEGYVLWIDEVLHIQNKAQSLVHNIYNLTLPPTAHAPIRSCPLHSSTASGRLPHGTDMLTCSGMSSEEQR